MPRDFYDLLGVSEEATPDELKAAYRAKAREFHPDVNADDRANAQFKTVRKAYEVLSDETERAAYDRMGHERYVSNRMNGLPTTDVQSTREGSRWSHGGTTDARDAGSAASGESTADDGSRTSAEGTASSASASSASASSSGASASASRRTGRTTTSGGGAAGGANRAESRREPGRTGRRVSPLAAAWAAVVAVGAIYVAGLVQYVRAHAAGAAALADALAADPAGAVTAAHGLGSPAAFAAAALDAGSLGLLFPAGAALLLAAFVGVVVRFGHGSAWLYAGAAAAPAVGFLASAALPRTAGVFLLVFVVLPVGATLAFAVDVGRYLWAV